MKPNAATDDEVTPLVTAAASGSSEIVELLLKVYEFMYVVGLHLSLKQTFTHMLHLKEYCERKMIL